jgi:predicted nuclease of predicted toxin-antitoxin system
MKFFFDNNLSHRLVDGLRGFGEEAIHITEMFPADTTDEVWLQHVGKSGMFLITRDHRIRWRPNELAALSKHNVGAFFLGGKNRSGCELIQQVVRNWPGIKELAARSHRPFAFRVPPSGKAIIPLIF